MTEEPTQPPPSDEDPTPAQRLRALELSGDPDAQRVAERYKESPFNPAQAALRHIARSTSRTTKALTKKTFAYATAEDAAEAEEEYAAIRAERARQTQARESRLFAFSVAADKRERLMLTLTKAAVVVALASLGISAAALIVAILAA